jgi:hypothetical protein
VEEKMQGTQSLDPRVVIIRVWFRGSDNVVDRLPVTTAEHLPDAWCEDGTWILEHPESPPDPYRWEIPDIASAYTSLEAALADIRECWVQRNSRV